MEEPQMLQKEKGVPLYVTLKRVLGERFAEGSRYEPLPSERELCKEYGVSRTTLRKAKKLLEEDGSVRAVQGVGTFAMREGASPVVLGNRKISFRDQVISQGGVPSSKVLRQDVEPADEETARSLGIALGDPVFHLVRLRYVDGKLFQINRSKVALGTCPGLVNRDFSGDVSLHGVLGELGVVTHRCDKRIEFVHADEYDTLYLGIKVGEPIALTRSLTYDPNGRLIECATTRSSAYISQFEMTLFGDDVRGIEGAQ